MLSPPVPIPAQSYFLAYHLKSQDASPAPSALRAFRARNRQISNGRLYLTLLCFWCDRFRVFTNAWHRAHAGAIYRCGVLSYLVMAPNLICHPGLRPGISLELLGKSYSVLFTLSSWIYFRIHQAANMPLSICGVYSYNWARHWQIYNCRLYLSMLSDRCDCFCVFAYARNRDYGGATFRFFDEFFYSPDFFIRLFTFYISAQNHLWLIKTISHMVRNSEKCPNISSWQMFSACYNFFKSQTYIA